MDKNAARRLAIIRHAEELTGNVALTCRYYGISRTVFYRWLRRYEAEGLAGLRDRSKRPQHSPHQTPSEVVGKIIYLRQNYHFGPAKISMYLKRYHDVEISNSGVWRILKRVDLSRLPACQRYQRHDRKWKRYESRCPGTRSRPTSSSSPRWPARARRSTTSSPPSTTAPASGCCGSMTSSTRRPRSSSPTTCSTSSRSGSRRSKQITGPSSRRPSTGTWPTAASATSTSSPPPHGSTARPDAPTASTAKSSTASSRAWSSTTPLCSTTSSPNGKPSTTTIAPTAPSTARPPTNAYGKRPPRRPPSKRSTSAAHMERVTGIEPALSAWEVCGAARVLPADSLTCGDLGGLSTGDHDYPWVLLPSGTERARVHPMVPFMLCDRGLIVRLCRPARGVARWLAHSGALGRRACRQCAPARIRPAAKSRWTA